MNSPANHRNLPLVGGSGDAGHQGVECPPALRCFVFSGISTIRPLHEGLLAAAATMSPVGGRHTVAEQADDLLRELVETLSAVVRHVLFVFFICSAKLAHFSVVGRVASGCRPKHRHLLGEVVELF